MKKILQYFVGMKWNGLSAIIPIKWLFKMAWFFPSLQRSANCTILRHGRGFWTTLGVHLMQNTVLLLYSILVRRVRKIIRQKSVQGKSNKSLTKLLLQKKNMNREIQNIFLTFFSRLRDHFWIGIKVVKKRETTSSYIFKNTEVLGEYWYRNYITHVHPLVNILT